MFGSELPHSPRQKSPTTNPFSRNYQKEPAKLDKDVRPILKHQMSPLEQFNQRFDSKNVYPAKNKVAFEDSSNSVKRKRGKKKKTKKPAISQLSNYKQLNNTMDQTFDSRSSSSSAEKTQSKPAKKIREQKPPTDPNDLFVIEDYNDLPQNPNNPGLENPKRRKDPSFAPNKPKIKKISKKKGL